MKSFLMKLIKALMAVPALLIILVLLLTTLTACNSTTQPQTSEFSESNPGEITFDKTPDENVIFNSESGLTYANNEILIVSKPNVSKKEIEKLAESYGAVIVGYIEFTGDYQWRLKKFYDENELNNLMKKLKTEPFVLDATLNLFMEMHSDAFFTPNDSQWTGKWDQQHPNGDNWGVEAIRAPWAWDYQNEMSPINVGLIDFDFNTEHDDLNFVQVFYNPPQNQISPEPHGTHVAGTFAAGFNNSIGISGIYPHADGRLYGVSTAGLAKNSNNISSVTRIISSVGYKCALAELIVRDVKVINVSLNSSREAGYAADQGNQNAINYLTSNANLIGSYLERIINNGYDFLIVSSAGNNSSVTYQKVPITNNHPFGWEETGEGTTNCSALYNSFFNCITNEKVQNRIIVVGAAELTNPINPENRYSKADFSNIGNRVDVMAPGVNITSTVHNDKYEGGPSWSGTSMAAPHVTGVAAMVWSYDTTLSGERVKQILEESTEGDFQNVANSNRGMVNALSALVAAAEDKGSKTTPTNQTNSSTLDFTIEADKIITLGEIDVIETVFNPPESSSANIMWSSSDESVATVSPEGVAGIISARARGTTTITATMNLGSQTITRTTKLRVASKGRDTILVLDVSGSMGGTAMDEMKKAAIQFCKDLLTDEYNNRVGLVCYDSDIYSFDLTNDLNALINDINSLSDGSATNMEGGLAAAKQMMETSGKEDTVKNIVLMADGCPNEGETSESGSFGQSSGYSGWFGYNDTSYFNAVVDTANEIKKSYNLYSLGFFHSLSGTSRTDAEELMRKIAKTNSDFYIVDKAENLQFVFGDIAESISDGSRIVINIACPVDVMLTYEDEQLSSDKASYNDSTSFGTLQLLGENQDIKVLSLDPDKVYDVELTGKGTGKMDYTVNYFDDNEELTDYRRFSAVPLSTTTLMYSSTDTADDKDMEFRIDENGDGSIDEILKAGKNTEITYETKGSDSSLLIIILIIIGATLLLVVLIIVIVSVSKSKKKGTKKSDLYDIPIRVPVDNSDNKPVAPPLPVYEALGGTILIMTGSMKGASIPIIDGETVNLGKDAKIAHVVFSADYKNVSRLHCTISYSSKYKKYYVTDCSSNGTYKGNRVRLEKGKRTPIEANSTILLVNESCTILLK